MKISIKEPIINQSVNDITVQLAEKLKQYRKEHGNLSVRDMIKICEVSETTIRAIEGNILGGLSVSLLLKVANKMGLKVKPLVFYK